MPKGFNDPLAWTGGCPRCYGPETKQGICVSGECRGQYEATKPVPEGPPGYLRVLRNGKVRRCKSCGTPMGYNGRVPLDLTKSVKVEGYNFAPSHFATCPEADKHRKVPA